MLSKLLTRKKLLHQNSTSVFDRTIKGQCPSLSIICLSLSQNKDFTGFCSEFLKRNRTELLRLKAIISDHFYYWDCFKTNVTLVCTKIMTVLQSVLTSERVFLGSAEGLYYFGADCCGVRAYASSLMTPCWVPLHRTAPAAQLCGTFTHAP